MIMFTKEINDVYMSKSNWRGEEGHSRKGHQERLLRRSEGRAAPEEGQGGSPEALGKWISTHRNGKCESQVFGAHVG